MSEEPGWCYNCGDYYANCEGDCFYPEDENFEDEDGCLFPDECCMPGFHTTDECHTAEMVEELYKEFAEIK